MTLPEPHPFSGALSLYPVSFILTYIPSSLPAIAGIALLKFTHPRLLMPGLNLPSAFTEKLFQQRCNWKNPCKQTYL